MSEPKTVKIGKNITWRKIAGRMVILNQKSGNHVVLNEMGMLIWDKITRGTSVSDIIDTIAEEYYAGREKVAHDVGRYLGNLEKGNFISL